jgi:hypothetical protein
MSYTLVAAVKILKIVDENWPELRIKIDRVPRSKQRNRCYEYQSVSQWCAGK